MTAYRVTAAALGVALLVILIGVGKLAAADIGTPLVGERGYATWYDDGPGLYGAVPSWHYGDKPYPVKVCHSGRCVKVVVRDFCACGDRNGKPTVIDLSPSAFAKLAPLSRGVITVTTTSTTIAPPATDTDHTTRWFVWPDALTYIFWFSVLVSYVAFKRIIGRRI